MQRMAEVASANDTSRSRIWCPEHLDNESWHPLVAVVQMDRTGGPQPLS